MKRIPIDIVVLLVIILASLGFAVWKMASLNSEASPVVFDNPVELVEVFIEATQTGNKQEAFVCLSTESQRRVRRFKGDKLETLSRRTFHFADYKLELAENDGRIARVVARQVDRDESGRRRRAIPYIVIKERGSWKIDMVSTEKLWYERPHFSPHPGSSYQSNENKAVPQNRERK